jgi:hypothetical protein
MKVYSLNPKGLHQFKQGFVLRSGLFASIMIGLGVGAILTLTGNILADGPTTLHLISLLVGGSLLLVVAVAIRAAKIRQQPVWDSIQVEMADDYIVWRQSNKPEMRIHRDEVTYLADVTDPLNTTRGLLVRTKDARRWISIPDSIQDYEEIKTRLLSWGSLRQYTGAERFRSTAIMVGLASCFLLSMVTQSPLLVVIIGLFALCGYALIYVINFRM